MKRYGMMTVERYIREGLPEGVMAFFEHNGKAVKLGYISSKDGVLHLHQRGNCLSKLRARGYLETPLYLSDLELSGTPIEDVKKYTRVLDKQTESQSIPDDLRAALQVIEEEGVLSDYIYSIRDREGEGWHSPRMNAWQSACNVIQYYIDHQPLADETENLNPWLGD